MDEPDAEPRYEIFHDVLALAVLDWRRGWMARSKAAELVAAKELTERRLRRTRLLLVGLTGLLVACLILAAVAFDLKRDADESTEQAEASAQRAEASEEVAETNALLARSNLLRNSDPSRALALALGGWQRYGDPRLEQVVRQTFDSATGVLELQLGSAVVQADFLRGQGVVLVTRDGKVRTLSLSENGAELLSTVDTEARVSQSVLVDHGTKVVVGGTQGGVNVVDIDSGDVTPVNGLKGPGPVTINAVSGSAGKLVALDTSKYVYVVNAGTGEWFWPGPDGDFYDQSVDSTGRYLSVVESGRISIWSTESEKMLASVATPGRQRSGAAESAGFVGHNSDIVLIDTLARYENLLWEWDWRRESEPRLLQREERVPVVARGSGGDLVAVGDVHAMLYAPTGQRTLLEGGATIDVTAAAVSGGQPRRVALGTGDGAVAIFHPGDTSQVASELWRFSGHTAPLSEVRFSPGDNELLTASLDGTVRIWSIPAPNRMLEVPRKQRLITARYAAEGDTVVAVTRDGTVDVIDGADAAFVAHRTQSDHVQSMDAQQYGGLVATVERGRTRPEVFSVAGPPPPTFEGTGDGLELVRWSPDETQRRLVATTQDNYLHVWDGTSGRHVTWLRTGRDQEKVTDLDFSADGSTLVTLSSDGKLNLVDTTMWRVVESWRANAPGAVTMTLAVLRWRPRRGPSSRSGTPRISLVPFVSSARCEGASPTWHSRRTRDPVGWRASALRGSRTSGTPASAPRVTKRCLPVSRCIPGPSTPSRSILTTPTPC